MVSFADYRKLLRQASWLFRAYPDVMLLADRGFASHELMAWLESVNWHYALRLKCDVQLHGVKRHPVTVRKLYPAKNEAILLKSVGLWVDGLRTQVDPHWRRGLSYLKIGLRYLRGVGAT